MIRAAWKSSQPMGVGATEIAKRLKIGHASVYRLLASLTAKIDPAMTRETKTRKELADLVMREARASVVCCPSALRSR
jgi:hypothetical protein